ncbi:MAG: N-acetylmuramoyl-L-alanine amidase [Alphaproteobacteria bacterium]
MMKMSDNRILRFFSGLADVVMSCLLILGLLGGALGMVSGPAAAQQAAQPASASNAITGLRLGQVDVDGQSGLRIVVEMNARPQTRLLLLESPWRLAIDSPSTDWESRLLPAGDLARAPASGYRFGHPTPDIGRLVIELDTPAAPVRAFILQSAEDGSVGYRFVVDLIDGGPTRFAVARQALAKSRFQLEERPATPATISSLASVAMPASRPDRALQSGPKAAPAQRPKTFIVAIDAGHGGKDPGALGKRGTREKDVTLKAAKMLAEELRKSVHITPILIRDSDRFYKLRTRIKRARDKQADIFVSLHADSAPNTKARGISVFSLSDTASDKEAAYLAKRENKADLIGGPDLDGEDPVAANALLRMFQRESMNESAKLATAILSNIKDLPGGDKRGHRFAGFAVLKSPDIPSILVEMGFLSNRQDEKNLRDDSYLRRLSKRLARAISRYLENAAS